MDTQPMIEHLRRAEEALRRKIEETKTSLVQAEEDLRNILGTIAFYERNSPMLEIARSSMSVGTIKIAGGVVFSASSLRGMSHRQAVIAIAKHNGGVIKAQDAKRLMIQAGVMRDTKNSTHMVHNAIISSDRFERIGRGEFRLRVPSIAATAPSNPVSAMATGLFPTKSPLQ